MAITMIKTLALAAALVVCGTALPHGDEAHGKPHGPVRKEQNAWGIAGDAKAVPGGHGGHGPGDRGGGEVTPAPRSSAETMIRRLAKNS